MDNEGFSLLEIVVALGLLAIVIAILAQLNLMFTRGIAASSLTVRANAIAAETIEALRAVKEENWSGLGSLTPNTTYYLSFSSVTNKWSVVGTDPGKIDGIFTRSFLVKSVNRDALTGKIVSSGGSLDSKTLFIEANVDWSDRGNNKNIKLQTYLADY